MQLDDFEVPGKNLVVKGNLEFRTEDIRTLPIHIFI